MRHIAPAFILCLMFGQIAAAFAAPAPDRAKPTVAPALPVEASDFAGAVLVDSQATGDHWEQITPLLLDRLQTLGLPLKALAVTGEKAPLVKALESRPSLVVLGSWREYSESELVSLEHYLWGGGRVLVAAGATAMQARLVDVNTFTGPLGAVMLLRRPKGNVATAAELGEVKPPPKLLAGALIRGKVTRLAAVGDATIIGAINYGEGTLVLADVSGLWQSPDYAGVVGATLKWLISAKPQPESNSSG